MLRSLKTEIRKVENTQGRQLALRRQFNELVGGEECCNQLEELKKQCDNDKMELIETDYDLMGEYLKKIDDLKQKLEECKKNSTSDGDWL